MRSKPLTLCTKQHVTKLLCSHKPANPRNPDNQQQFFYNNNNNFYLPHKLTYMQINYSMGNLCS